MDASTNHESEDRMSAASHLEAAVLKMLSVSYTHKEINNLVRKTVLDEGAKLPSRRVLYNQSYGGFGFSVRFKEKFLRVGAKHDMYNRENPLIIQTITDFGREICTRFPFILEDLNVAEKWKLKDLIGSNVAAKSDSKGALDQVDTDLAARLVPFKLSSLSSSRPDEDLDFVDYAETHPETWMFHRRLSSLPGASESKIAVRFAHQLLHDAPEIYRDQEPSTRDIDTQIYECIGLAGASDGYSALCLGTVPAMVDYTIDEYDGLESVKF
jgi:hypothetical protein